MRWTRAAQQAEDKLVSVFRCNAHLMHLALLLESSQIFNIPQWIASWEKLLACGIFFMKNALRKAMNHLDFRILICFQLSKCGWSRGRSRFMWFQNGPHEFGCIRMHHYRCSHMNE
jgi:hypothetical protein